MTRKPARGRQISEATAANGVVTKTTRSGQVIQQYHQLALADDRNPWERQPDEPDQHYGWFALYKDMPPYERTVLAVMELVGRSRHTVYDTSARNRWRERAQAWDQEELRKWVLRQDAARKKAVGSHLRLSDEMIRLAMARLRSIDPERMSLRDLVPFIEVATKISRAALGLDTPALVAAMQVNVDRGDAADAEEHKTAQAEAAAQAAEVMASLASLAGRMTEEQRAQAVATWVPPAIEGEVVEAT